MVARRAALQLSQPQLVERLALHGWKTNKTRISRYENGSTFEFGNDPAKVDAMRRALDVHPWVLYFALGMIPPEIHVPAEEGQIKIGMALLATALGKIDLAPPIAYDAAKRIHLIEVEDTRDGQRRKDRMALERGAQPLAPEEEQIVEDVRQTIEGAVSEEEQAQLPVAVEPAEGDIW